MTSEHGDEASVANAANWLRLIFHSLTCSNPACVLEERCTGGKALLTHVLTCTNPGACTVPSCTSVRRLTLHWLRCQDTQCRLCAGVWRDLSGHDETNAQQQPLRVRARLMEPLPPEAPGTPDRNGVASTSISNSMSEDAGNLVGDGDGPSGQGHEQDAAPSGGDMEIVDVEYDMRAAVTDRAVIQLQEATSYMRYLLYCLMCRDARDSAARGPGLQFWLSNLMSPPLQGHAQQVLSGAAGARGHRSAGRRLLGHRLLCQNPYCALCSGTCELFTRGQGLRRELPVPNGLRDMDLIVHELSLALGSVNL
ncbi:hypothetical protein Vretimale_11034 [Volvox reticuliferus]|uniref:TAZ-type domain-containing protein n=1 Tax=Volvox reticuliferus TaxID=1737510 RepID=A0A8J4FTX5_9CHLO|nr:hypothetical protein Vretifemale_12801 [Volvox reticuliferus]GIM06838.1 hypothetical protein Vretimale_11034 [Volvox reticuliferus]